MPSWLKLVSTFAVSFTISLSPATAETITLSSHDGTLVLTGELLKYDGHSYVIRTSVDDFTIDASTAVCTGAACILQDSNISKDNLLTISGSNTIGAQLMPRLIELYALKDERGIYEDTEISAAGDPEHRRYVIEQNATQPTIDVDLLAKGSSTGIRGLIEQTADIAMSSRPIREKEVAALIDAQLGDPNNVENQVIAGLDGLIIVVPQSNPIESISIQELADVFSGQITNWAELGGADQKISVYRRDDNSGTTGVFLDEVMKPAAKEFADSAAAFTSNQDLVDAVIKDAGGIGFTGIAYQGNTRALPIRNACGFLTTPSDFSVKTGEYPLARKLFLFTLDEAAAGSAAHSELIEDFTWFVQTDDAQMAVTESGFVNQSIVELPIAVQGQRLVNTMLAERGDVPFNQVKSAVEQLSNSSRLSSTFRFQLGHSELDVQAQGDIPRLVDYILHNDFTGKQITFVGFTDSVGDARQNSHLSRARADAVLSIVQSALGPLEQTYNLNAIGLGETAPLGCNNTDSGRDINRRVEVWIRPFIQN